jgi:hypothetical protein
MMRKTFGLVAAGLVATLGFALTTTPAGANPRRHRHRIRRDDATPGHR